MKASKSFWAGALIGAAVMAYGVVGLLGAARRTHPFELATYVIGAALVHDLLVAPLALMVAAVVGRIVPARVRAPVLAVFVVAAVVSLFAFPFVRGYGRNPSNPSALPGNYASGLATVLTAVVAAGAASAVRRGRRARTSSIVSASSGDLSSR